MTHPKLSARSAQQRARRPQPPALRSSLTCSALFALLSACEAPQPKGLPAELIEQIEAGAQAQAGEVAGAQAGVTSGDEVMMGGVAGAPIEVEPLRCEEGLVFGGPLEPVSVSEQPNLTSALLMRAERGAQGYARLWLPSRAQASVEAPALLKRLVSALSLNALSAERVVMSLSSQELLSSPPQPLSLTPLAPLGQGLWLTSLSLKRAPSAQEARALSEWLMTQGGAQGEGERALWRLSAHDVIESRLIRALTAHNAEAERPWARLTLWAETEEEARRAWLEPAFEPLRAALKAQRAAREASAYVPHATSARVGERVRWTSPPAQLPLSAWLTFAEHPRVVWVGPAMPTPSLLNEPSRSLTRADEVQNLSLPVGERPHYLGYTGRGVRAAIMDSGVASHPDFFKLNERGQPTTERARGDLPLGGEGHGTIVAGILGGSGWLSARATDPFGRAGAPLQWRGQAPETEQLISYAMMGEPNADERAPWVQAFEAPEGEREAHLINHSHTFGNGYYGPENQGYDAFTSSFAPPSADIAAGESLEGVGSWKGSPRPAFFAAGNNGVWEQAELLRLRGYYGLMVNFKDLLVVGALESNDAQHADFSSLGPTLDGRVKPDVAAPGSSDPRPLNGFSIKVGEVRLHAREGSGARDLVWSWSRPSGWRGEGGLNPDDEQRPALIEAGSLSGFTFGNSWQTYLSWAAGELDEPIDPRLYDELSFEVRYDVPPQPNALTTPSDRPELPLSYELPQFFQVRWADDEGQRFDGSLYFAYGELKEGEWSRARASLSELSWAGEDLKSLHRLVITPGLYLSGVYTPSIEGGYTISSGTSMASPAAAGVGALALEQLNELEGYDLDTSPPRPATLRALMTHSARDLSREEAPGRALPNPDTEEPSRYAQGPDWNTGYGLIDAWAQQRLISAHSERPRWLERVAQPLEVSRTRLEVREGGLLKVSLAWDDPPASLLLEQWAPKLIHDLDLAVVGPLNADGSVNERTKAYGPWVLTPPPLHSERYMEGEDEFSAAFVLPAARCERPSLEALWSGEPREGISPAPLEVDEDGFVPRLNRGCADELNTYEEVLIEQPEAGLYELVVRGPGEGSLAQPYTLMWSQSCAE